MGAITTSVFELFKIGPGPSSSHTIGPMVAARDFVLACGRLGDEVLARARRVEVRLLGSLAATGQGHGTVRAILAGLAGHAPESCPPDILDEMAGTDRVGVRLGGYEIGAGARDVLFDDLAVPRGHPNTMILTLLDGAGAPLFTRVAHSVGGGFVEWEGEPAPARPDPPHAFSSMADLLEIVARTGKTLPEILIENEQALTGLKAQEIGAKLEEIIRHMEDSVERGLEAEGLLPGPLGLQRKAKALFDRYRADPQAPDASILALCACAFATAEENAASHVIVTAPTAGSAGVLASVLYVTKNLRPMTGVFRKDLRDAMLAAAVVGLLAKHNASVSGAEVGCQGEIGVASAMAAAYLCQLRRMEAEVTENAAETALEHHLGITCDPVRGYVQIPCIERNAMGAVKAYAAHQIASAEVALHHMVGLDEAIRAMAETGRDMNTKYKETAQGGLASFIRC